MRSYNKHLIILGKRQQIIRWNLQTEHSPLAFYWGLHGEFRFSEPLSSESTTWIGAALSEMAEFLRCPMSLLTPGTHFSWRHHWYIFPDLNTSYIIMSSASSTSPWWFTLQGLWHRLIATGNIREGKNDLKGEDSETTGQWKHLKKQVLSLFIRSEMTES